MTERKVITENVFAPIPDRRWDWRAYREGDEEDQHKWGWGASQDDALDDLIRLERERDEAEQAERYLNDGLHSEEWQ